VDRTVATVTKGIEGGCADWEEIRCKRFVRSCLLFSFLLFSVVLLFFFVFFVVSVKIASAHVADALSLDIIDAVAPEEELLASAIKLISHADGTFGSRNVRSISQLLMILGKNLKNYGTIKKEIFGELEHRLLNQEPGPKVNFSKL
jgi:hypothetical protein